MRRDAVIVVGALVALLAAVVGVGVSMAQLGTAGSGPSAAGKVRVLTTGRPTTTAAPTTTTVAPTTTAPPATTTTTAAPMTTSTAPVRLIPAAPAPRQPSGSYRSTAYCLRGRMASGRPTYVGAVAGNRWPIGTILTAWPNPWNEPGMEFTVEDRHKPGATEIDFAMPGECDRALRWGNRQHVQVTVIGGHL